MNTICFCILLFFSNIAYGAWTGSLTLINDSAQVLTAVVQTPSGKVLYKTTLKPGENSNLTGSKSTEFDIPTDSTESLTPYTVIWKCDYKGYYSTCSNVSPGSTITANSCMGAKFCEPKPDKKEKFKCCPCPPCPKCPENKNLEK